MVFVQVAGPLDGSQQSDYGGVGFVSDKLFRLPSCLAASFLMQEHLLDFLI